MAVINSIRKRSSLLLTIVLLGVVLFILGDLIANQFRKKNQEKFIAEVDGQQISASLFAEELDKVESKYFSVYGRGPLDHEKDQLKEQAWNQLLYKTIYTKEFKKLGIKVTRTVDGEDNEENDMLGGGRTMDDGLKSSPAFANERGEFDMSLLNKYISIIQNPQNSEQETMKRRWVSSSEAIYEQRLRTKYTSLLSNSTYVTNAEAEKEYIASEKSGVFDYIHVPFSSIADSLVAVEDSELKKYLNGHEEEFNVSESRVIDYVVFPIEPNETDVKRTKSEIDRLKIQFTEVSSDSSFAKAKTDIGTLGVGKYTNDELPQSIESEPLEIGKVYGPYLQAREYKLYKYMGVVYDTVYKNPSASHILFSTQKLDEEAKANKKAIAEEVLERAKKGDNFIGLAIQYSEDPGSKQKGGDLGSFTKGQMVKPFEEAVFGSKKTGVVPELIETAFGYHIINVTAISSIDEIVKKELFAQITKQISAGRDTRNGIFREASLFLKDSKESEDFDGAVENNPKLTKIQGIKIAPNSRFVGSLGEAKEIVNWAYQQAKAEAISDLIKLEGKYVVATVTKVIKANDLSVDNLKDQLKEKVLETKKAELIKNKLKDYSGSLSEIKDSYNNSHQNKLAILNEGVDLKLSSSTLGSTGFDPIAVGAAFATKQGEQSSITIGENGVYIFKTISIQEPGEIADYTKYKERLKGPQAGAVTYKVDQALKKLLDVDDKRYLVY